MRPWVTALSMSGGKQSFALWKMIQLGILARPLNLLVTNAWPGMEATRTRFFVDQVRDECVAMGVPFLQTSACNLYEDILALKRGELTRLDNPPFWTRNRTTGKRGRLQQSCTPYYKIAPMDRLIRTWMEDNLGVAKNNCRIGANAVRKWIGFSADEIHRIKEPEQVYQFFEYPLIELGWGNKEIMAFYLRHNLPIPPRSVCNACFANDVAHFKTMHAEQPADWAQAVAIDDAIRDLTCIGITDECFVSWTLIPLRDLAAAGFPDIDGEKEELCHSGHCFV
jgi:hypothetical protein